MTLLDDSKIITTANSFKAGTLYSIKPDDGTADFTITRSSTATRVNPSGNIESVAVNAPQINYADGCGSFLVEPQRTNLYRYSEEIDNAAWVSPSNDVTVTANAVTSPDGTTNADECETTSNFSQMYQTISLAASTTYTWSFYVKKGTMTDIGQQILNFNGDGNYGTTGKYYSLIGSDWTRVSFTFTTGVNGGNTRFYPINASGVTGSIYLWGFQIEQYSADTSYIPTTSASVTRVKTVWEATGLSSIIKPTEGVFMAEIRFPSVPTNGVSMISLSSGSMTNMVNIGYWAGFLGEVKMGGSGLMFAFGSQPAFDNNFHKIAVKYKSGDCALWFDGVETKTSTTTGAPTGTNLNTISGTYGNNSGFWPFFGEIRQIQYYEDILTDAQLLDLTTP